MTLQLVHHSMLFHKGLAKTQAQDRYIVAGGTHAVGKLHLYLNERRATPFLHEAHFF